jgi:hypothetical protein
MRFPTGTRISVITVTSRPAGLGQKALIANSGNCRQRIGETKMKNLRTIAVLALAFTGLSTAALAEFKPSAALRSACMGDAMKLCNVFTMSMDDVGQCLVAKRSQTSPQCQAAYDKEMKGNGDITKKAAQK